MKITIRYKKVRGSSFVSNAFYFIGTDLKKISLRKAHELVAGKTPDKIKETEQYSELQYLI